MSAVAYIYHIMQINMKNSYLVYYLYRQNVHIFYMHISTIFPLLVIIAKPLINFSTINFKFHSGIN